MTGHDVLVSHERRGEFLRRSIYINKSLYFAWNHKLLSYIQVSYTIEAEKTSQFLSLTIG